MNPIMQAGFNGVQSGLYSLNRNAQQIVQANSTPNTVSANLTTSLVELVQSKQQVQASVGVVETGADVLGTLIDLKV